jgi:4-aminobutyrate aminotransferase-like enzyme
MAAALRNLEVMEQENLVENSDKMGRYLHDRAMAVLQENHPSVGYVGGGLGLWMSIELVKNRKTKEEYPGGSQGEYGRFLTGRIRDYGLATRAGSSISLSPPLIVTRDLIDEIVDILDRAIGEAEKEFPPDNT